MKYLNIVIKTISQFLNKRIKYFNLVIVVLIALLLMFPLWWMITGSFRLAIGAVKIEIIPTQPTLRNYVRLLRHPVLFWTFNSFVVALITSIVSTLINTMAGYAFAKKSIPLKEPLFIMFLAVMMIPAQISFIPLFLLIKKVGLFNTRAAMIIPGLASAFYIFFLRQYLKDFPNDLLWTADIDGCGEIRKFLNVILPLSKPALAVCFTMTFMGQWNNFFFQLIIATRDSVKTLPVGIAQMVLSEQNYMEFGLPDFGIQMAGATYSFLPMLLVFIVFQKQFVTGLFSGALKG